MYVESQAQHATERTHLDTREMRKPMLRGAALYVPEKLCNMLRRMPSAREMHAVEAAASERTMSVEKLQRMIDGLKPPDLAPPAKVAFGVVNGIIALNLASGAVSGAHSPEATLLAASALATANLIVLGLVCTGSRAARMINRHRRRYREMERQEQSGPQTYDSTAVANKFREYKLMWSIDRLTFSAGLLTGILPSATVAAQVLSTGTTPIWVDAYFATGTYAGTIALASGIIATISFGIATGAREVSNYAAQKVGKWLLKRHLRESQEQPRGQSLHG